MFDDPQTVIGMIIGLVIIAGGTLIGVSSHRRRTEQDPKQ